jgi:uncharacterized protein
LVAVPTLTGRVNDLAELLAPVERQQLEKELAAFETETSHQIVVLTIPSLEGEAIESFSLRAVEEWTLGHRGIDNGVLLTVASGDRKARIEVGYGLEGVVPDAVAAQIIRDRMIPSFRQGRMGEGVLRGSRAVLAAARGEQIPPERRPSRKDTHGDPIGVMMFCGIMGGVLGSMISRRSRPTAAAVGSTIAFTVAYLILGVLVFAGFAALMGAFFGSIGRGGGSRGRGGGIVHLPSGGWGGGGFGGGGFGGGGGSFGGGGASGGW